MVELERIEDVLWCSGMFRGLAYKCYVGDGGYIDVARSAMSEVRGQRP